MKNQTTPLRIRIVHMNRSKSGSENQYLFIVLLYGPLDATTITVLNKHFRELNEILPQYQNT